MIQHGSRAVQHRGHAAQHKRHGPPHAVHGVLYQHDALSHSSHVARHENHHMAAILRNMNVEAYHMAARRYVSAIKAYHLSSTFVSFSDKKLRQFIPSFRTSDKNPRRPKYVPPGRKATPNNINTRFDCPYSLVVRFIVVIIRQSMIAFNTHISFFVNLRFQ